MSFKFHALVTCNLQLFSGSQAFLAVLGSARRDLIPIIGMISPFCSSTFPRHVFVVHIGWLNQSEKRTPFSIHRFPTNHLQIFVFQLSSSMYMGWWHMLQVLAHLHQYGETLQSQTPLHHFVANANANGSSVWNNYIPNYNTRCLKSEPWRFCVTALFIFSILNAFVIKTSLPQKCANCRIDLWSFRLNQINI